MILDTIENYNGGLGNSLLSSKEWGIEPTPISECGNFENVLDLGNNSYIVAFPVRDLSKEISRQIIKSKISGKIEPLVLESDGNFYSFYCTIHFGGVREYRHITSDIGAYVLLFEGACVLVLTTVPTSVEFYGVFDGSLSFVVHRERDYMLELTTDCSIRPVFHRERLDLSERSVLKAHLDRK